jgi:pyrroline-5-carboxylate reductase
MFKTLCFIGSGRLASALIDGLTNVELSIHVASPNVLTRHQPSSKKRCFTNNQDAIIGTDAIILAVKPHQITTVLKELAPTLKKDQPIISLAAGVEIAAMQKHLDDDTPILRAMPNIAARINESATTLIGNQPATPYLEPVTILFEQLGTVTHLKRERDIDTATIIAGSSPAFLYLFLDSLSEAAAEAGLDKHKATILVEQAALGAVKLAKSSKQSLPELISQVTSKNGTTEAGLDVFTKQGFKGIVKQSVKGALARANALKKESN